MIKKFTFAPAFETGIEKLNISIRQKAQNVNTLSFKTISAKKEEVVRKWYLVDAEGKTAGRLFSSIAAVLMGKHKPSFTSHVDTGDFVIVVNADKIRFTGNKLNAKEYLRYSGYPGGQKRETAKTLKDRKPEAIVEIGVQGMLPKTKLGRAMGKKLFVYAGSEHPHQAQQPEPFNF